MFTPVDWPEAPGVYVGISDDSWEADDEWCPVIAVRLVVEPDGERFFVPDYDDNEMEGLAWYQVTA